jgi:ABC-type Zn2+ transport system substrate-binding protein/surface adhesin
MNQPTPLRHPPVLRAALTLAALALAWPLSAGAHEHGHHHQRAHTHGHAELDVAVDPRAITLHLNAPLDSFLGFERAPRNDAERKRVTDMLARLEAADSLFRPDPAAGCKLSEARIDAPVLEQGKEAGRHAHGRKHDKHDKHDDHEHADLEMHVVFACTDTGKARFLDLGLFDAFERIRSIAAQIASTDGQFKRTLRPGNARLDWGR